MAEAGLVRLVVASPANIRYLTGFSGSSALVLVSAGAVIFLSDFRYRAQSQSEIGDLARIIIEGGGLWDRLLKVLPEHPGVLRVGFEAEHLTARDAERLNDSSRPWRFVSTVDLVESLRAIKAPEEVDAIRRAGSVATEALAQATAQVRPGLTEYEVAALLEARCGAAGASGTPSRPSSRRARGRRCRTRTPAAAWWGQATFCCWISAPWWMVTARM